MDTDYVGTATVTLKDWEGNTYQETAPVVKSGAAVTFTELDASSEFYVSAYDTKGNPIADFGGTGDFRSHDAGDRNSSTGWTGRRRKSLWGSASLTGQAAIF